MNRLLYLILLLFLLSCSNKDEQQTPAAEKETGALSGSAAIEQTSSGADSPSQGNNQNVPATASDPPSAPEPSRRESRPTVKTARHIQSNMEKLLFNSRRITAVPLDFDFGEVADSEDDERYRLVQSFIRDVWLNENPPRGIHPNFKTVLNEIVNTVRNGESFSQFRIGRLRSEGTGYHIPFRVMNETRTGTGYLFITAQNDTWYVQDLIFNAENSTEIEDEIFAPSMYRWMEVY